MWLSLCLKPPLIISSHKCAGIAELWKELRTLLPTLPARDLAGVAPKDVTGVAAAVERRREAAASAAQIVSVTCKATTSCRMTDNT